MSLKKKLQEVQDWIKSKAKQNPEFKSNFSKEALELAKYLPFEELVRYPNSERPDQKQMRYKNAIKKGLDFFSKTLESGIYSEFEDFKQVLIYFHDLVILYKVCNSKKEGTFSEVQESFTLGLRNTELMAILGPNNIKKIPYMFEVSEEVNAFLKGVKNQKLLAPFQPIDLVREMPLNPFLDMDIYEDLQNKFLEGLKKFFPGISGDDLYTLCYNAPDLSETRFEVGRSGRPPFVFEGFSPLFINIEQTDENETNENQINVYSHFRNFYVNVDHKSRVLNAILQKLHNVFLEVNQVKPSEKKEEKIKLIKLLATFVQTWQVSQPFHTVNNSCCMAIANYFLRLHKLKGISHGALDFLAFRLTQEGYQEEFLKRVLEVNPDFC